MSNYESRQNGENLPVEADDDAVLGLFSGATFGPNASLTLPSGAMLRGAEAQAFTSAFADPSAAEDLGDQADEAWRQDPDEALDTTDEAADNPLSSRNDNWTGDPATDRQLLIARAAAALPKDL